MEYLNDTILVALAVFLTVFGSASLLLAYRILTAPAGDYQRNKNRHFGSPWLGRVKTHEDGRRDFRVSAGLNVRIDGQNREWVQQGIISDEAVDIIIAPRATAHRR
jgi:hypothetical protein